MARIRSSWPGLVGTGFAARKWLALAGIVFLPSLPVVANEPAPLHVFDFSNPSSTPTYDWLEEQGFELKRHADNPDHLELYHANDALHVVAKQRSFGIIAHEGDIPDARVMRVEWGVSDFPDGASYEHGIDNEAIMVFTFFGHEEIDSGEMFIPDSPYFIGFYLCPTGGDPVEQPFKGHHYHRSGRYVCVDHPAEGEFAVSEIDLDAEFRKSFGLQSVPRVSGIALEVDTTDSGNDGHAAAFLRRIAFLP